MTERSHYDAVVVGAGPNGISAALHLARAGLSVLLVEAKSRPGGGCRSDELTLPGFQHDVCSSVYPLGLGSPYFRTLPLSDHGLEWIQPEAPLAHPFPDGETVFLERSIAQTALGLKEDGDAYHRLLTSLTPDWDELSDLLLSPYRLLARPYGAVRFGLKALQSAETFSKRKFRSEKARAFFAGMAAHSTLRMDELTSAAYGLVLALAGHAVGWPIVKGGAQKLSDALMSIFYSSGGEFVANLTVRSLDDLPPSRLILLDVTPRQMIEIGGARLPPSYIRRLKRYRYGPAVFKLDWALERPVNWLDERVARAATVHLGASLPEIAMSERVIWQGGVSERPFVIIVQPSLFDGQRAPEGKHTLWGYCHVPNSFTGDMTESIEKQIERVAPSFKETIMKRHVLAPCGFEDNNSNYIGGDINGGALVPWQLFSRPLFRLIPYATPVPGLYLCSSSTPPGGGVHGMSGYYAAECALRGLR